MRVLGYRKIPVFKGPDGFQWQPTPFDCFYFAKEACKRMDAPGTTGQSRQEIMMMVEEAQTATSADYLNQRHFTKGKDWLLAILNKMIRDGDREVCEALCDAKRPAWRRSGRPRRCATPSPARSLGPSQLQPPALRAASTPEWSPRPNPSQAGVFNPLRGPAIESFLPAPAARKPDLLWPKLDGGPAPSCGLGPTRRLVASSLPMPTHPRSNSVAEFSPIPTPLSGPGSLLPPLQPRLDTNVQPDSLRHQHQPSRTRWWPTPHLRRPFRIFIPP